jgi:hypothetical protein
VVHFSGGDYSTFCKSSISDPVFGSPGQLLVETAVKERGGCPDAEKQLPGLLAFTSLWTSAIVQACLQREIAVVLGHDTTFFDKAEANELELQSDLGKPTHKWQVQQFANHRKFGDAFYNRRQHLAERLKVPLAGWGLNNDITFVDEFHCDRDGTHLLSDAVADALAPILEDVRVKSAATVE